MLNSSSTGTGAKKLEPRAQEKTHLNKIELDLHEIFTTQRALQLYYNYNIQNVTLERVLLNNI